MNSTITARDIIPFDPNFAHPDFNEFPPDRFADPLVLPAQQLHNKAKGVKIFLIISGLGLLLGGLILGGFFIWGNLSPLIGKLSLIPLGVGMGLIFGAAVMHYKSRQPNLPEIPSNTPLY